MKIGKNLAGSGRKLRQIILADVKQVNKIHFFPTPGYQGSCEPWPFFYGLICHKIHGF